MCILPLVRALRKDFSASTWEAESSRVYPNIGMMGAGPSALLRQGEVLLAER